MVDVSVSTTDELMDAIDDLGQGDTIDATDAPNTNDVPSGTLDGEGVRVYTETDKTRFLRITESDTTLRGIQLDGHVIDTVMQDGYWDYPDSGSAYDENSTAIRILTSDAEVSHITARGWTEAGIMVGESGGSQVTPTISNCELVHNNCRGLGYGIVCYAAYPVIEWCYFNNNRHDISGSGETGCGYEARNNKVGDTGRIYSFEMHDPGGESVHVHNNTFEDKYKTKSPNERCGLIVNRGEPTEESVVEENWFKAPESAKSEIFIV